MAIAKYAKITLLVNPASGSGYGGQVLQWAEPLLARLFPQASVQTVVSQSKEHIQEVARSSKADLLVCVSGDGSVHDLAQPLMRRPPADRPVLAVVPVGSGNDYA